jgi:hypothetical protein
MTGIDAKTSLLLQIREAGLPPPEVEAPFKGISGKRRFRFDYAWPARLLAVEYQGGIYSKGPTGHRTAKGMKEDMEKLNEAVCCGWRVLYVNVDSVASGDAVRWIETAMWRER